MSINKLPTIAAYWRVDNLISNDGIQSTMIRNHFCEILQNLHFADNGKDDKTDKAFKMRPEIDHLKSKFSEALSKDLEQSFCTVYFDNFFNSPKLIEKLFQKGIYGIGTVRANRKQMPKMIDDKQMKRGDCEFLFSGNTMACKWMDNRSVLLLSSALEGMNDILSVQRREKSSKTKSSVPCPKVVKLYNSSIGGIDLIDQRTAAYDLDRISSVNFTSAFSLI